MAAKTKQRALKLGLLKIVITDGDAAEITITRRALAQFVTLLGASGGAGAAIATAIQGGF